MDWTLAPQRSSQPNETLLADKPPIPICGRRTTFTGTKPRPLISSDHACKKPSLGSDTMEGIRFLSEALHDRFPDRSIEAWHVWLKRRCKPGTFISDENFDKLCTFLELPPTMILGSLDTYLEACFAKEQVDEQRRLKAKETKAAANRRNRAKRAGHQ